MVLKGVNWLHDDKIRLNVLKEVINVLNEEIRLYDLDRIIRYTIQTSGHMVLKAVN